MMLRLLRVAVLLFTPAVAGLAGCAGRQAEADAADETPRREGLVEVGERAPAFQVPDQAGRDRTLAEFAGQPVVLYFYPKDATPGCTREACAFRDAWDRLQAAGAVVLGVSRDDVASHARFAREHDLPFPLLADTDGEVVRAYGVGESFGMPNRVTFLIGPDGLVRRVYPRVDPGVHADEVIAALRELTADPS